MRQHATGLVPGQVIAVREVRASGVDGSAGKLEVTEPHHPDAVAFEISGTSQTLGRARCRVSGLVSNRAAKVSIPVTAVVWTTGSVVCWPAAANALTSAAA